MKKIIVLTFFFVMISLMTQASAQEEYTYSIQQLKIEITIDNENKVHVIHEIKKSDTEEELIFIPGKVSNVEIYEEGKNPSDLANEDNQDDEDSLEGKEGSEVTGELHEDPVEPIIIEYYSDYTIREDNKGVTLGPSSEKLFVEYDLEEVLFLKNGIWTWDFLYLESISFFLPQQVDLILANDRPVPLDTKKGLKCHGCQMVLEYIVDEPVITKEIVWDNKRYSVDVRTLSEIQFFEFNQPSKSMSFSVMEDNSLVTLIIPLELLWNPYEVYFEGEGIWKHEFSKNTTHVWLNIRPETAGNIMIIGTSVIPEFPIFIPLIMGMVMVLLIHQRKNLNLH